MAELEQDDARERALNRLKAQRSFRGLAVTAVGVLVLMIVIWALSGGGYFWPIWVVFGLGVALVASGWQAYGPRQRPITEDDIRREIDEQR
ncbi:MAG TPA: 2TM domain-containing protein [Solirubrobacterales bacterium]|nr:2TM domain-containing protein [Solirubrobacterales bacterium]